jgi:hypothetical protein
MATLWLSWESRRDFSAINNDLCKAQVDQYQGRKLQMNEFGELLHEEVM